MARIPDPELRHLTIKYGDTMMLEQASGMGNFEPGKMVLIKPDTDYTTPGHVLKDGDWFIIPWHRVMSMKIMVPPGAPTS